MIFTFDIQYISSYIICILFPLPSAECNSIYIFHLGANILSLCAGNNIIAFLLSFAIYLSFLFYCSLSLFLNLLIFLRLCQISSYLCVVSLMAICFVVYYCSVSFFYCLIFNSYLHWTSVWYPSDLDSIYWIISIVVLNFDVTLVSHSLGLRWNYHSLIYFILGLIPTFDHSLGECSEFSGIIINSISCHIHSLIILNYNYPIDCLQTFTLNSTVYSW